MQDDKYQISSIVSILETILFNLALPGIIPDDDRWLNEPAWHSADR